MPEAPRPSLPGERLASRTPTPRAGHGALSQAALWLLWIALASATLLLIGRTAVDGVLQVLGDPLGSIALLGVCALTAFAVLRGIL